MFRDPPIRNDLVIKSNKRGFLFFILNLRYINEQREERRKKRVAGAKK